MTTTTKPETKKQIETRLMADARLQQIARECAALRDRRLHPDGEFDKAGRWYPSDAEKCPQCDSMRSPSRAWPYSYMVHCRTINHVCARYRLAELETKIVKRLVKLI